MITVDTTGLPCPKRPVHLVGVAEVLLDDARPNYWPLRAATIYQPPEIVYAPITRPALEASGVDPADVVRASTRVEQVTWTPADRVVAFNLPFLLKVLPPHLRATLPADQRCLMRAAAQHVRGGGTSSVSREVALIWARRGIPDLDERTAAAAGTPGLPPCAVRSYQNALILWLLRRAAAQGQADVDI